MKKQIKNYVGRLVRLNKETFQKIAERAARSGEIVENFFVVATANAKLGKLVCYGANTRVTVSLGDVVFV